MSNGIRKAQVIMARPCTSARGFGWVKFIIGADAERTAFGKIDVFSIRDTGSERSESLRRVSQLKHKLQLESKLT